MNSFGKANLLLGLGVVVLALVLIFVWVPLDTTSGIASQVRRQFVIGDALAPTVAGVFLLVGGAMVLAFERQLSPVQISPGKLGYVLRVCAILAVSFTIMRYAGPLAVWLVNAATDGELVYRQLRGTTPWKQSGYFLGAWFAIAAMISLTDRRVSGRSVLVGALAALGLVVLYDLPFDDLLLPPNGDV
ncbi:MAG: hypothetical protein AAGF88_11745 [Pseudomonadota bacterium]